MDKRLIPIVLDKPRNLALPMGALKRAQTEINAVRKSRGLEPHSIFWIVSNLVETVDRAELDVEIVIVLLWAALTHEDAEITVAQVEAMPIQIMECMQKLVECISAWMRAPSAPSQEVGDAALPLPLSNGSMSGLPAASTSG
jgi:hypothetical protein